MHLLLLLLGAVSYLAAGNMHDDSILFFVAYPIYLGQTTDWDPNPSTLIPQIRILTLKMNTLK